MAMRGSRVGRRHIRRIPPWLCEAVRALLDSQDLVWPSNLVSPQTLSAFNQGSATGATVRKLLDGLELKLKNDEERKRLVPRIKALRDMLVAANLSAPDQYWEAWHDAHCSAVRLRLEEISRLYPAYAPDLTQLLGEIPGVTSPLEEWSRWASAVAGRLNGYVTDGSTGPGVQMAYFEALEELRDGADVSPEWADRYSSRITDALAEIATEACRRLSGAVTILGPEAAKTEELIESAAEVDRRCYPRNYWGTAARCVAWNQRFPYAYTLAVARGTCIGYLVALPVQQPVLEELFDGGIDALIRAEQLAGPGASGAVKLYIASLAVRPDWRGEDGNVAGKLVEAFSASIPLIREAWGVTSIVAEEFSTWGGRWCEGSGMEPTGRVTRDGNRIFELTLT